jgi:membrane protease YdiL (CAAX protease family)
MSSLPEQPDASQSFPEAGKDVKPVKPRLWMEICVVLALAALPAFFQALGSFWLPRESSTPFTFIALNYLIRAIQETVPVLYIMRISGKPWGYFGLTRPRPFLDIVFAAGLFVSLFILMSGLARLFPADPLREGGMSIGQANERGLFLILVICFSVGFGEELVMRGYLVPRLEELLGSSWESVLVSAVIFAICHIHKDVRGVLTTFLMALIFGGAFCLIRRVWPFVLAHAVWNLVGYLKR